MVHLHVCCSDGLVAVPSSHCNRSRDFLAEFWSFVVFAVLGYCSAESLIADFQCVESRVTFWCYWFDELTPCSFGSEHWPTWSWVSSTYCFTKSTQYWNPVVIVPMRACRTFDKIKFYSYFVGGSPSITADNFSSRRSTQLHCSSSRFGCALCPKTTWLEHFSPYLFDHGFRKVKFGGHRVISDFR